MVNMLQTTSKRGAKRRPQLASQLVTKKKNGAGSFPRVPSRARVAPRREACYTHSMSVQTLKARYKDGALQLLDFISIPEGEEVMIQVQTPSLPAIDADSRAWLEGAVQDMTSRVDALEAELPHDRVEKWHKAMARASKPARYVEGKGIVVE